MVMREDWVVRHLEVTGSTNVDAAELARAHDGQVVLVRADRQDAGRGRAGRNWASPMGGAWFSVGVPVRETELERMIAAPLVVGLAACRGVNRALGLAGVRGVEARIKWPNDLVIHGKKTGGVLCELVAGGSEGGRVLVAGVGVNVNLKAADLPGNLRFPGTTLREAGGRELDVSALVMRCARGMVRLLRVLAERGFEGVLKEAVEARMAWMEDDVVLDLGDGDIQGRIVGVDESGRLKALVDGRVKVFDSGEVRVMGRGS